MDETGSSGNEQAGRLVVSFIELCAQALSANTCDEGTRRGAAVLASALEGSVHTPDRYQPGWLPALDTIVRIPGNERAHGKKGPDQLDGTDLADAFVRVARLLPWRQASQAGADTGQVAVSPLDLVVDIAPVRLGLMYVIPGARTALHHHPPQEVYLLLTGPSSWRYGRSEKFRSLDAAGTLFNHPNDLHAAEAGDTPLVAMFVLWD